MTEDVSGDLVVSRGLVIPAGELRWHFSRSSGPGGQAVNTTDSRVELRWDPGESRVLTAAQRDRLRTRGLRTAVVIVAAESRSQWQNRRIAREKLAAALRQALAPPPATRRPTRPTRGAQERRLAAKRRRGETKRQRRARWE